jgi:transmembrane sensor
MCESLAPHDETMKPRFDTRSAPEAKDAALDPLTERALEWLVHLHSGSESEQDWSEYQSWKAADAGQRQAAEQAERLWQGLGSALTRPATSRLKRAARLSLLILALGAAGFAGGLFGAPGAYFPDERTATGERRSLTLPDGSRLELDAVTSLDIDFSDRQRRLVLHAGRIFVAVSPDRQRPFRVESGGGTIQALGTAFAVGKESDAVEVVVAEHAVRVAFPDEATGPSVEVQAGNQISYAPDTGLGQPRPVEIRSRTAWRRGLFLFESRPLGAVVAELERYRRGRIVIADNALKDLPVTGIFETGDSDALLDAVVAALPVQVHKLPWLTVIRRAPERSLEPFQPRR